MKIKKLLLLLGAALLLSHSVFAQIGQRFASERKVVNDPVTADRSAVGEDPFPSG